MIGTMETIGMIGMIGTMETMETIGTIGTIGTMGREVVNYSDFFISARTEGIVAAARIPLYCYAIFSYRFSGQISA